jgi:hypothetical protein
MAARVPNEAAPSRVAATCGNRAGTNYQVKAPIELSSGMRRVDVAAFDTTGRGASQLPLPVVPITRPY